MPTKAALEMTLADHRAIGSTPPKVLADNPEKTYAETMSDAELQEYMQDGFSALTDMYRAMDRSDVRLMRGFKVVRDEMFIPNLAYLRTIGRLPADFKNLDVMAHFELDQTP